MGCTVAAVCKFHAICHSFKPLEMCFFSDLHLFLLLQVDRGVRSPADISMDITKLVQTLKVHPVSFEDGVRLTLKPEADQ